MGGFLDRDLEAQTSSTLRRLPFRPGVFVRLHFPEERIVERTSSSRIPWVVAELISRTVPELAAGTIFTLTAAIPDQKHHIVSRMDVSKLVSPR